MNKNLFCNECDIEYRVRHDSNDEIFIPLYCPFCGMKTNNIEEQYEYIDEEESDEGV